MNRIVFAAIAGLCAVAARAGIGLRAAGGGEPTAGPDRRVNPPGLIDANNSPTVARDPRRPDTIVISHRVDRPGFSAALQRSRDGGRTWQTTALPLPAGLDRPYAPDVAFAPDGTLYVVYVNLAGGGNVPDNLWLSRSGDGGRTLSAPVRVAGPLAFQARIAVDEAGAVHLTWLQAKDVGLLSLGGVPSPIVSAASTDGGHTFSRPVRVSDPARELVGAASPVIDADGDLVVLYEDFQRDRRDFENLDGPPWGEPFSLVVTRPLQSGAFAGGVELEKGVVPTHRFLAFLPEFPSLAAGPGDTLYVAWADGRNGDEDVFLRRSDDDGATWSAPVRVNDGAKGDGSAQYLPRVDVAPDGRVDVLYLDRRDAMTDAMLAASDDRGSSFHTVRLSSRSFDARIGPRAAARLPVDAGTRLGLDSGDERSIAAWTDTRLGTTDTGRQDVFAAAYDAPVPPLPARPAAIAALALLAVAFTVLAIRAGRRRGSRELPRD